MKNSVLITVGLFVMLMTDGLKFLTGENKASATYCFYIEMYDSFGDGWNGGTYTIYDWNYWPVATGTLDGGSYDWDYYCLPDGCYTISVTGGTFPSEISWDIWSSTDGELIYGYAPIDNAAVTLGYPYYGCTDYYACNYNSLATCNDGSCCYGQCLYVQMYDSYGDGWNGGYLNFYNNAGDYLGYAYLDNGYSGYQTLCLESGCYTVQSVSGSYPSEISWNLYDYNPFLGTYDFLLSGGVPIDQQFGIGGQCESSGCINPVSCNYDSFASYSGGGCCLDNCVYMYMYDSFGDGWNAAEYNIRDWNGEIRHHGTLYDGDFGVEQFCLPDGCYTVEVTDGYWPSEISWILYDPYYVYVDGGSSTTVSFAEGSFNVAGCTDPAAGNFDPDATCDDGSCLVTCEADLNGDGAVNVTDLLIFMGQFGLPC